MRQAEPLRPLPAPPLNPADREALIRGASDHPHDLLGPHAATLHGRPGAVVRAFDPRARAVSLEIQGGETLSLTPEGDGLFAAFIPRITPATRYTLRFDLTTGATLRRPDPYRFAPTIGPLDLHLIAEGQHNRLWQVLGAHPKTIDNYRGTAFTVWAPNARRVSVLGEFSDWDGRLLPMRRLGPGVWELFVPDVSPGARYKFEILTREHQLRTKTDPLARSLDPPPEAASRVLADSTFKWTDEAWLATRAAVDPTRAPMLIYEVHLGSWAKETGPDGEPRPLTWHELADRLCDHVIALGFTHLELLPVAEHPFTGSWGYQVTGYFAPTQRHGDPDGLRHLIDTAHGRGLGVLLDWVPAHFPRDDYALRRFDGTALYEPGDPRRGEHPDWGTLIFDYGRPEVRNFLIANALYWLAEFHIDGLRVDAVSSMLYLDYGRRPGEWLPNEDGGRENLDAIAFLRALNTAVQREHPGCFTVAEEATAFPKVTASPDDGGLGFTFKWNMGWMHDTLEYFALDPIARSSHHAKLTFGMMYERTERFIMPLSHDEVVHLKRSLLSKMPGDAWQQLANLRALLAWQYTRPGKKLLFMGSELAPPTEWNHDKSLDWDLLADPTRAAFNTYVARLGALYRELPALWRGDPDDDGFAWLDVNEHARSILAYVRRAGDHLALVILNLTPVPRPGYTLGVPFAGTWRTVLSSDDPWFGGSGYPARGLVTVDPAPLHDFPGSLTLDLPPLAALVLVPEPAPATDESAANTTDPSSPPREPIPDTTDPPASAYTADE